MQDKITLGTADAVRQNLRYLLELGIRHVLVLSGDQPHRMNYQDLIDTHRNSGADVTIATVPFSTAVRPPGWASCG